MITGLSKSDFARLAASLALYEGETRRAVQSALRRGAQATVTRTKRRLKVAAELPTQKAVRTRAKAYGGLRDPANEGRAIFKAWLGTKYLVTEKHEPTLEAEFRRKGAREIERRRGLWYSRPWLAFPIKAGRRLWRHGDIIEEEARQAWRTDVRTKLTQELATRKKRTAKTSAREYHRLLKAENRLRKFIEREGEIQDA